MKKSYKISVVVFALVFLSMWICVLRISAGTSNMTVDNNSFSNGIDNAVWSNPEGDVLEQSKAIVFPKESTQYTRLIAKAAAYADEFHNEIICVDCTLQLQSVPMGKSFILALGLDSIESYREEEGSLEIALQNDGGVKASVSAYQGEKPTVLTSPRAVGIAVGGTATIQIIAYKSGQLTVKIGENILYNGESPVSCEGRFGFLQTGSCQAKITKLKVLSFKSDNPENCDIAEDFESGSINTALLTSKMMYSSNNYPSGLDVQKYAESNVLMFHNVGLGYIGTTHQYSNFEITFDVPYLCRKTVTDEKDGSMTPRSEWFGISYGLDISECDGFAFTDAYDMVYFSSASVPCTLAGGGKQLLSQPDPNYKFFDSNETRGFTVQMSVIDAEVTVKIRWIGEKSFHTLAKFPTNDGTTPLGYVHIWSYTPGNFAIDNLKIVNKDHSANLIDVKEKSGKVIVPDDYEYNPEEAVYRPAKDISDKNAFNWYIIIPFAAGVALLTAIGGAVFGVVKRRKEAAVDETQ